MENSLGVTTRLPKRPDLTPPSSPAPPIPSYGFYLASLAVSVGLIAAGFLVAEQRWAGLWSNLGCNYLASVVLLIVIERRVRPVELGRLGRAAGGAVEVVAGFVGIVSPVGRDVMGYARAVLARVAPRDLASYVPTEQFLALERAAAQHPGGFVLVGPPGAGKTTFMQRRLAAAAARAIRHPHAAPVPVMMPLQDWHAGKGVENLRETAQRYYAMRNRSFDKLLARGRFVFLLEGLDEVDPEARGEVVQDLRDLRRRFGNTAYIVSTRPTVPADEEGLPVLEMRGLTEQERRAILSRLAN